MPNIELTEAMTRYAEGEVERGAYADIGEVVRAGMRLLMEREAAWGWFELKAAIDDAVAEVEAGKTVDFDPLAFEPEAFDAGSPEAGKLRA